MEPSGVVVRGPLAPYAEGFCTELVQRGYAPSSASDHLRLMAHLSRWLQEEGVDGAALTAVRVEQFLVRGVRAMNTSRP